jgi:uncharacterized protein (DUF58 family)
MRRFGGAFALGAGVTAAALAFGSRPVAVAGIGLLIAAGLMRAWVGLARCEASVSVAVVPERAFEGDRVLLDIRVRRRSRIPVGSASLHVELGKLGEREIRLHGQGRSLRGSLDLAVLPRGAFRMSGPRLVLGDHLGLTSVVVAPRLDRAAVVVYPRLVSLRGIFSEAGSVGSTGRRLLLRRPAGFDFHSVRDYEQGESLRRVHWPTSARRGRLMVKELQDSPHDDVVVVLDCDPAGATGAAPDSSFDAAARAAGSLVEAHAGRGRTVALVTTGRERSVVSVRTREADRDGALMALAAAEPDTPDALGRTLRGSEPALSRGSDLVVVTATPLASVSPLLVRLGAHRLVSVVWIDAPSFAGRPTRADPGLLRLAASGIPIAVVRHREDLASALGGWSSERLARA